VKDDLLNNQINTQIANVRTEIKEYKEKIKNNVKLSAKKLKTATNKADAITQAKEGKYSPGDIVTYTEDGKTYTGLWTGVTFL
jgi:conjugal transfer/entry exclusion protein